MKKSVSFTLLAVATIVLSALGLGSCKNYGGPLATDNVSLSLKSDTLAIANIKIDYPIGGGKTLRDSARAYIYNVLGKHFIDVDENGKTRKTGITFGGNKEDGKAVAEFYCKEYQKEISQMRKTDTMLPSTIGYIHDVAIKKVCDTETFVTFLTTDYNFLGGAHGSETVFGASLSKDGGHLIAYPVDTTKTAELQPLLRKGLLNCLSKQDKNINEKNLTDFLFIEHDTIPMPSTSPYFMKDGIAFVYQQYEIAPYSSGHPTFIIPYKDIAPYLTKEAFEIAEPFLKK